MIGSNSAIKVVQFSLTYMNDYSINLYSFRSKKYKLAK